MPKQEHLTHVLVRLGYKIRYISTMQPHQFYKMFENSKLLVLATLLLLIPQLSTGGKAICLPQDAPVSEFL